MTHEVKLYQLKAGFAKHNHLMIYFVATTLVETQKALYLYGHGTTETVKMGVCCRCGRTLTHPVSVELGIGPECGNHWWNWDLIGGYTKENLERLKGKLVELTFDSWIPKSQIVQVLESNEVVNVPLDHPMLKPRENDMVKNKKRVTIAINKDNQRVLKIYFPYDSDLLKKVRDIPGRQYHPDNKCWSAPMNAKSIEDLIKMDFVIEPDVIKFLEESKQQTKIIVRKGIPGLKGTLYPFQNYGVAFIEAHKGRALIADEMGLGKTIQALAWLQLHRELRPAIVIVPASLKLNWEREALSWLPDPRVELLSGTAPWTPTGDILIINYDILPSWLEVLKRMNPKVLITDECHYYKNNGANRTKAVKRIGKVTPCVIALSGTPIVNRPNEAYNAINLINPDLFPNFWNYSHRYCNARYNGFGWDFSGASNTEELHEKLVDNVMLRRLKKDVLPDLPDKIRSFIPMELSNAGDYGEAERNFIEFLRRRKGNEVAERASNAEALVEIEVLKQLAVKGKLSQAVEWIRNFLDVDGKLVVFAVHRTVIDTLMSTFGDVAVKVDGSVSQVERQRAVDRFQNDEKIRLFIGNIQAAGVGLTLTAASNVAFLELPWTPGAVTQAEDRCHRIGQKDSVSIYYLLATGTIEEKIATLLDSKRKVLDAVLDGRITDQESLLSALIKSYDNESNFN